MAVTATNLTANDSAVAASSFNTASVNVVIGRLYLLTVSSIVAAGTVNTPTVTGASQTWDQVVTKTTTSPNARRQITTFRCVPTSNGSGALTVDFAAQSQTNYSWTLTEFQNIPIGANGATAIVQSASAEWNATNTGATVSLSAFASASNATHAVVRMNGGAVTAEAGYTELSNTSTNQMCEAEFKASSDTTPSWTWASVANTGLGVAFEIAVSAPATATPSTASLTLSTFAPTVTVAPANVTATPSTLALTLTTFAPTVTVALTVTPSTLALVLSTFAPTVSVAAIPAPVVEARVAWRPDQFNHVTNPTFATNTTGWSVSAGINAAGTSITRVTTDGHSGSTCGSLVCPATALTGVNFDFGTQPFYAVTTYLSVYRFVVWLKSASGTTQARMIVGSEGTSADRASRDVTLTTEWQPFYLDWAPTSTETDVQLAIVNIPAVAMTARIADVSFFLRDAHTQIENGYFTTNTTGWSVGADINAAGTSITRQSSGGFYGSACGRLVTTSTSGSGMNWPMGTAKYTSGRTYRARVYAKSISGTTSARLRLGSVGTAADRGDASVTLTTSWAAYTVDWTPSGDRTDAELAITNGAAAVMTADFDGIEVYESLDDISADAFGPNGGENLTYGRGASFDGSGQATGFATVRVFNAMVNGKYMPDYSSGVLYGLLQAGRPVLVRATYSGVPYGVFYGRIDRIVPMPMDLVCEIRCVDPLESLSRMSYYSAETSRSIYAARQAALNFNTIYNYALGSGPHERSYCYTGTNERSLLDYLEDLCKATGSIHFIKPSVYASIGWQYVTVDRSAHSDSSSTDETWNDDMADITGYDVTTEALVNRQRVSVNAYLSRERLSINERVVAARQVDILSTPDVTPALTVVESELSGTMPPDLFPLTISSNETRTIVLEFGSPVRSVSSPSASVSAMKIESTRVTVYYRPSADTTVVSLDIRGVPLVASPINDSDKSAEDSIALYGEHQGQPISSDYIQHPALANGIASWSVWRRSTARARPTIRRQNLFASQLGRDIGDAVSVTSARLSLSSAPFGVLSFQTTVAQNARDWQTSYSVERLPDAPTGGWFVLGSSALDSDDSLTY